MIAPLLKTKMMVPQPKSLIVSRPQLIERLNEGLNGRLTLISAPAGSGKTTLVQQWIATLSQPHHLVWLSLDENDNDPAVFFAYLLAAIQTTKADVAETTAAFHLSPKPPLNTLTTYLINDLAALGTPLLLILDDLHTISNDAILQSLDYLIKHQPPQAHLVFISRTEPILSLAQWRARGELTEIKTAESVHPIRLGFNSQQAGAAGRTIPQSGRKLVGTAGKCGNS